MSEQTKIEWATHTFNPWIGCTKVSPGCLNCYAENTTRARVLRSRGQEIWGKGNKRVRTSASYWKDPLKWSRESRQPIAVNWSQTDDLGEPAKLFPPRPRIFPSLCDWLDDEVPIEWLADFLKLIHDTPHLDWLLLTKRPENFQRRVGSLLSTMFMRDDWRLLWLEGQPPANVWLGTSVEDQQRADDRIPELLRIPAAVRFLSVEPLLGPVDLRLVELLQDASEGSPMIHWVIIGGESGTGARPCHVELIRDLVLQCQAAGVACFVKQLGSHPFTHNANMEDWPDHITITAEGEGFASGRPNLSHPKGGDPAEWPEHLRVREFPERRER